MFLEHYSRGRLAHASAGRTTVLEASSKRHDNDVLVVCWTVLLYPGPIPKKLGDLFQLKVLSLSKNSLTGV